MTAKRFFLFLVLLTGIGCGTAQAQLLKKLEEKARQASEKLEKAAGKVSSALETVNQTLDTVLDGEIPSFQSGGAAYPAPRITQYTVRVPVPEDCEIVAVGDGIVTLKSQYKLNFYSIAERRLLFDFEWEGVGGYSEVTAFSGGVCAAKKGSEYYILYPDGTSKVLPEVREIGNFRDGVAAGKKKKGDWGSEPAFFNRDGEPVLGALTGGAGAYADLEVGKLVDGVRAVKVDKWGYINSRYQVLMSPTYDRASAFSEGLAVVSSGGGRFGVIDKNGAVVLEETVSGGYYDPRAFHDGWAFLPGSSSYMDRSGALQECTGASTDFYKGVAIAPLDYSDVYLVGKDFQTKKVLKTPDGGSLHIERSFPDHFVDGRYLLVDYANSYLFDHEGKIRLATDSEKCFMTGLYDGGAITLTLDNTGTDPYDHDAFGVAGLDGRIVVIFDRKARFTSVGGTETVPEDPDPPIIEPPIIEPPIIDPPIIDPPIIDPPIIDPPIKDPKQPDPRTGGGNGGRKLPPTDTHGNSVAILEAFTVSFDGEWPDGKVPTEDEVSIYTNILPGTVCQPGDTLRFAVVPPENARVKLPTLNGSPVLTDGPGAYKAALPADYSTVHIGFAATEELEMEEQWALHATTDFPEFMDDPITGISAEVYLVTDPKGIDGTPFGKDTKGLFSVEFDSKKKFTAYWNGKLDQPIPDFASLFWGPWRILGFREENGTKYMYLTGGITAVGNWMDQQDSDLGGMLITLIISFSSFNNDNTGGDPTYVMLTRAHKYRLSYADLPDGGMKLGLLERFSPAYGWVPSDDKRLIEKKSRSMGFMTMSEQSEQPIEPNVLNGLELRWVQRPKKLPDFYPDRSWCLDDEQYQHTVAVFNREYQAQVEKSFGETWYTREECQEFVVNYAVRWALTQVKLK